jgi:transcriptional regulator with XRE-family HTH domain
MLREWRQRRRMSQLDLALEADISTRHLSFVETGRAQPSREMLLNLAERLEIPLRERNALLNAAGFAALFPQRPLTDPSMQAARKAIDLVLAGHEPYPALAIDRHWNLVASNSVVPRLLEGVDAELLQPPVNVLRLSVHPKGLAPRLANLMQWRAHLIARLHHQVQLTADPVLAALLDEVRDYPVPASAAAHQGPEPDHADVVVPFQLITPLGTLSFLGTTTLFGTPVEVTLSELAIESFFPADAATAAALRQLAGMA